MESSGIVDRKEIIKAYKEGVTLKMSQLF